jgi:hypothetical protein
MECHKPKNATNEETGGHGEHGKIIRRTRRERRKGDHPQITQITQINAHTGSPPNADLRTPNSELLAFPPWSPWRSVFAV